MTSAEVPDERRDEPWSLPKTQGRPVEVNAQFWEVLTGDVPRFYAFQSILQELDRVEVGAIPGQGPRAKAPGLVEVFNLLA